jgi:glyoxylase-like metal-dependent hydrolase (beta-lactamase superfamily II)
MSFSNMFKQSVLVLAFAVGFSVTAAPLQCAHAAAPQFKESNAAFYRFMLGKFEVTALSDGTTPQPVDQLLANISPGQVKRTLAANDVAMPFEMNFNAYLVNTGTKLVLIDTGAGTLFGPNLGKMIEALKASGYTPNQVDEIYITHLHPDHVGGLIANGKAVFPYAVVRINKLESDFWLSRTNLEKTSKDQRAFFEGAQAALKPYLEAGKYRPFDGSSALAPGIKAVPLLGHTPGHTAYLIESEGQRMLVWGDVIHVGPVQFAHPTVTIHFDVDSTTAEAARLKLLAEAASQGYWIAGAHVSFPGIGHVRAVGKDTYRWVPAEYIAIH